MPVELNDSTQPSTTDRLEIGEDKSPSEFQQSIFKAVEIKSSGPSIYDLTIDLSIKNEEISKMKRELENKNNKIIQLNNSENSLEILRNELEEKKRVIQELTIKLDSKNSSYPSANTFGNGLDMSSLLDESGTDLPLFDSQLRKTKSFATPQELIMEQMTKNNIKNNIRSYYL